MNDLFRFAAAPRSYGLRTTTEFKFPTWTPIVPNFAQSIHPDLISDRNRGKDRIIQVTSPIPLVITFLFTVVFFLNCLRVSSADNASSMKSISTGNAYYVATTGGDSNDGTSINTPFRNIQKCASAMVAGDTCYIRAGTYRETVIPSNSGTENAPIQFQNYAGESVAISGADQISGVWTVYSGDIYRTNIGSWDFDQLFVDGVMNLKAQWPNNVSLDMLNTSFMAVMQSGGVDELTDSNIPGSYWGGGKLWMLPGAQWVGFNRTITAYDPTLHRASFGRLPTDGGTYSVPIAGNEYYLFDKLEALDVGGEWFLDKTTHDLYLMTTAHDSPANHTVEAKARVYAFDLSNKSYITVDGINMIAGNLTLKSCSHCTVKNGSVKYPDYFENAEGYTLQDSGIVMSGDHNKLYNLEIAYTPGAGINVSGIANEIIGNRIHDVDWTGGEYGAITYGVELKPSVGEHKNITITNNKIYRTGRSGLLGHYSEANAITYNTIYDVGVICNDLGVIYIDKDGGMGGAPSIIAYNTLRDNNKGSALYFDTYADGGEPPTLSYAGKNYTIHHNKIYNIHPWAAFHVNENPNEVPRNLRFYNNSTYGVGMTVQIIDGVNSNIVLENNIGVDPWVWGTTPPVATNNLTSGDPLYVNPRAGNFDLQPTSPAIDAGMVIPGITDGFYGSAPDQGAVEYRGP
jgi:hypothetical protein